MTSKRVPLYMKLRAYLVDKISRGEWKAGDRLPSENALAEQFDISRITVKKALQTLVEEGEIYQIQGRGTFITHPSQDNEGAPLSVGAVQLQSKEEGKLIAYLMPRLATSFTANLLVGAENEVTNADYGLLFFRTHNSQAEEKRLVEKAIQCGVKGIIVFPVDGEKYNEALIQLALAGFPLVLIDREMKGIAANSVCSDHSGGAQMATRHLIEQGHRTIGFVSSGDLGTTSIEQRLHGYEEALAEHGIPIRRELQLVGAEEDDMEDFLRQHPDVTAVFADNYGTGHNVELAAARLGRTIPEHLSLVFFDDYEYSRYSKVPPTVVVQQEEALGREAAKRLLSLIGQPDQEPQAITLPTKLIVRSSTGAVRGQEDDMIE
ncbi:GntR family transcriptional regulator [Paenibacillaceae bacterium]|nr:GntR family transcriptional regulator [Paenibacillaceae bacterium]